jgi:AAA+ ATPase superfamily predicted ATPase
MTHIQPIDRETEIVFFDDMLAGKTEDRILLVEAGSGWGKSVLLREFTKRLPKGFVYADIDFKSRGVSLAELLSRLCDKLGWKHFSALRKELQSFVRPSVNVGKNTMFGQNQIEVYLNSKDEQERQARLSALTDTFFTDLRSIGKTVLIFDTFEKADEIIRNWLTGAFLSRVQNSPNLFVVIGGRRVPEQTLEWECSHIPLKGISHEHWFRYAESMGVLISVDFVMGCCSLCNGHPLRMKSHIDSLVLQRRIA